MIPRKISSVLQRSARQFPVITLLGPRQSGKTTLVRHLFPDHTYINLENPQTRKLYSEDPKSLLGDGKARTIIDEAQRKPEVLSWVQVFANREYQRRPFAMEIKAGKTYVSDMIKPLRRFRSLKEDLHGAVLLYSGEEAAVVDQIKIVPYRDTAALLFPEG